MNQRAPSPTRVADVGSLMADRLLTISGSEAAAAAPLMDPARGGLVLVGKKPAPLAQLTAAYPEVLLMREPTSARTVATPEAPFDLPPDDGLLAAPDLSGILDGQREAGAAAAITPTRYFPSDSGAAMEAAVRVANSLYRRDMLLWIPCEWKWAGEARVARLIAILRRSRHPVALSLADRQDPLAHKGVPAGLRRIAQQVDGLVLWRTDLAGIDAMVHGASAMAVGVLPSQRHLTEAGGAAFAARPDDKTPHVFVRHLLRYVQARKMQERWFASIPAPVCECRICSGRPLDRFTGSPEDRTAAHLHNVAELMTLHGELLASGIARRSWWREQLDDARAAHQALAGRTSTDVPFPPTLNSWAKI
jgi:hypothetical protein